MRTLNKFSAMLICLLPSVVMVNAFATDNTATTTAAMVRGDTPPAPPTAPKPPQAKRMMWVEHINVDGEVGPEVLRERASEMRTEAMRERFREFDLDGDGFITQTELTEVLEARARENAEQMFQRWGDDGTGMISEERFLENHQERQIHVNRLRGSRDLSAEDRERIRQARELAREAGRGGRERVIELRGERAGRMRVLEQDISRTVDEDGNEVIIIKRTLDNGN